jgi:hypothetical protein
VQCAQTVICNDFRLSHWYTVDADPACVPLHRVYVGRVADVSKVHPASIISAEVKKETALPPKR